MNKDQAKQLLPIITAFAEGETIQYRHETKGWINAENPHFGYQPTDWRIKPKPR